MTTRNNKNYKRLCSGLQLEDRDVVEVMATAGHDTSRTRANGWGRGGRH